MVTFLPFCTEELVVEVLFVRVAVVLVDVDDVVVIDLRGLGATTVTGTADLS